MSEQEAAMPTHLGFIMDGNRRWAKERGLASIEGHRAGADTFKAIVRAGFRSGVKVISAYAFSSENWKRTKQEVKFLMSLFLRVVDRDLEELHKEGIKVVILGSRYGLSEKVIAAIDRAEARTKSNTKGILAVCFNYGGQQELVDAVKQILQARVDHTEITEELIAKNLYHPELPPLDMIIRTSGERRLSNFMMWRAAYAELYFTEKYWPDFAETDLSAALGEYAARERRMGK